MRGLNVMVDFMRRPSMAFDPAVLREVQEQQQQHQRDGNMTESPMTPMPENLENYAIDDEFNVPISVAIVLLLTYMLCGAAMYCMLEENWSFFESFYFVFISISTIGAYRTAEQTYSVSFFYCPPLNCFSLAASCRWECIYVRNWQMQFSRFAVNSINSPFSHSYVIFLLPATTHTHTFRW
jgi:hypothetical protein